MLHLVGSGERNSTATSPDTATVLLLLIIRKEVKLLATVTYLLLATIYCILVTTCIESLHCSLSAIHSLTNPQGQNVQYYLCIVLQTIKHEIKAKWLYGLVYKT
jgi:hypothetical protein